MRHTLRRCCREKGLPCQSRDTFQAQTTEVVLTCWPFADYLSSAVGPNGSYEGSQGCSWVRDDDQPKVIWADGGPAVLPLTMSMLLLSMAANDGGPVCGNMTPMASSLDELSDKGWVAYADKSSRITTHRRRQLVHLYINVPLTGSNSSTFQLVTNTTPVLLLCQ